MSRNIDRGQVAFENYLKKTVVEHPLPWRACYQFQKKEWVVVASDRQTVVVGCADWAEAQATANYVNGTLILDVLPPH